MRRGHGWLKRSPEDLTGFDLGSKDSDWLSSKVIGALSTGSSMMKRMAPIEFCSCATERYLKLSKVTLIPQIACDCKCRDCLRIRKTFPRTSFFRLFRTQRRAGPFKRAKPRSWHCGVNWSETGKWYWRLRSPGRGEPAKPTGSQTKSARKRHWTRLCRTILFPQFAPPS